LLLSSIECIFERDQFDDRASIFLMVQNAQKSGSVDARPSDVYLQPHSDDICFSLGAFAYQRHCGILLTVFPISGYVPLRPGATHPAAEWVTKTRIAEDTAFAEACGLNTRRLEFQDASRRGQQPFNLGWVDENLQRIKSPLLNALLIDPPDKPSQVRPWLFCPSGIGGHVDHVAIRMLVNQNYDQLSPRYRIGYYEDLHYASSAAARSMGINNLLQGMRGRQLHRYVFPLGEYVAKKLALIQLYKSQFLALPRSIEQFTPAVEPPTTPHEAIWSDEPAGPLLQAQ
jgi:LmbE family N-acetylglucosaminyl deacetylase